MNSRPLLPSLILLAACTHTAFAVTLPPEKLTQDITPSPITRDVTVIAWVRGDTIQLPAGANQGLVDSLASSLLGCPALTFDWRSGKREKIFSDIDRRYANAFLLKNSANQPPPNSITPATEISKREHRLLNRAKAEFRVTNGAIGALRFIHSNIPEIGDTFDPCKGWVPFAGEAHPLANGKQAVSASGALFQLNEGRIGPGGQAVNRTLNACSQFDCEHILPGPTTPWIWSTIRFDSEGNLTAPLDHQIFPTYYVYEEGRLKTIFPQDEPEVFILRNASSQRLPEEVP